MPLSPGDCLLLGQYRIERQLGRGGFGFVYQAQDTILGDEVAVKELIPALVGDAAMLKRFLAEAKATMRLTHERIVRTFNVFQEDGNYYIVMECMAGGSLEDRLRKRGGLPTDEAVRVAAEVCQGLHFAHGRGVVHCDLKPANILFAGDGSAKIADFGIAHVSEEMLSRTWMTPAGFVAGTLPYMSPEQADGVRDAPRVDVYAVGAVLYRMLTGQPYLDFDQRETPGAQADNVYRIRNEQPLPPSRHNRRAPGWLDGVVLQALAKEPERRYAGADELRAALLQQGAAACAIAETVQARTDAAKTRLAAPRPEPAPATRRERRDLPRLFWPLLAGAAAVLLVIVVAALWPLGGGDGGGAPTLTPIEQPRPTATPLPTPTPTPDGIRTRDRDGMQVVYVPAGEFLMGSSATDGDAYGTEKPHHTVFLDAFWIDRTEVSNAQYRQCVEAGICHEPTTCGWGQPTYEDETKAGHPVVCVSWEDATDYCNWARARLPTEAEWEKAARGTDGRIYPWGDRFDGSKANYCDASCEFDRKDGAADDGYARTAPVGSYPDGASPYGALDMAGNAWEWVADWFDRDYYSRSPQRNPEGPNSGAYREPRGGSWKDLSRDLRSANRFHFHSSAHPTSTSYNVGFRCVQQ